MSEAPKINYNAMVPSELSAVKAERDRAQQACEQMGRRISELTAALGRAIDYCDAADHGDDGYAKDRRSLIRAWRGQLTGKAG